MAARITDPLLQPTVTTPSGGPPWRLTSIGFVAFFGGVLAGTFVALLNGRRLAVERRVGYAVAALGLVGFVASLAAWVALDFPDERGATAVVRIPAVLIYLVQAKLMRPADLGFQMRHGDGYGSLWGLGIVTVLSCLVVEDVVRTVLLGVFR